jgi:hypothetical protein
MGWKFQCPKAVEMGKIAIFRIAGNPSKRLTILSDAEKDALYGLPDFDDFQRVEFFAMTNAECSLAMRRRGIGVAGAFEQIFTVSQTSVDGNDTGTH